MAATEPVRFETEQYNGAWPDSTREIAAADRAFNTGPDIFTSMFPVRVTSLDDVTVACDLVTLGATIDITRVGPGSWMFTYWQIDVWGVPANMIDLALAVARTQPPTLVMNETRPVYPGPDPGRDHSAGLALWAHVIRGFRDIWY